MVKRELHRAGVAVDKIAKATGLTRRRTEYMVRYRAYNGTCPCAIITVDDT